MGSRKKQTSKKVVEMRPKNKGQLDMGIAIGFDWLRRDMEESDSYQSVSTVRNMEKAKC